MYIFLKSFLFIELFFPTCRILQLKDAGIIVHLIEAERYKIFGYKNMTKILHPFKNKTNNSPVSLEHLQGGFILFGFGCAVAVPCFIFELITGFTLHQNFKKWSPSNHLVWRWSFSWSESSYIHIPIKSPVK